MEAGHQKLLQCDILRALIPSLAPSTATSDDRVVESVNELLAKSCLAARRAQVQWQAASRQTFTIAAVARSSKGVRLLAAAALKAEEAEVIRALALRQKLA